MITTPTYILLIASRLTANEYQTADLIFSRGLMGLVLLAFFADQQQWRESIHRFCYPQGCANIPDSRISECEKRVSEDCQSPPKIPARGLGPRLRRHRALVLESAPQFCGRAVTLGGPLSMVLLDYQRLFQLDHCRSPLVPHPLPGFNMVYGTHLRQKVP